MVTHVLLDFTCRSDCPLTDSNARATVEMHKNTAALDVPHRLRIALKDPTLITEPEKHLTQSPIPGVLVATNGFQPGPGTEATVHGVKLAQHMKTSYDTSGKGTDTEVLYSMQVSCSVNLFFTLSSLRIPDFSLSTSTPPNFLVCCQPSLVHLSLEMHCLVFSLINI